MARMHSFQILLILFFLGLTPIGCSEPDYATIAEEAAAKVTEAEQAVEAGDDQLACDLLTEALKSGGVPRQEMFEVCKLRALCEIRLQKYDLALRDVNTLVDVAPNLAEAEVVRAHLLQAQGKLAEAKAVFRRARAIDPRVQPIATAAD